LVLVTRRLAVPVVLVLALVASLAAASPAAAVGPFGPVVTVTQPNCFFDDTSTTGDSVVGSDGIIRGFVSFAGGSCGANPQIRYFQGSGASWTSTMSPYRGRVLGVAWDGSDTFLLHLDGSNVRITKRDATGFTPGRILSSSGGGGGTLTLGDVIASGGQWWAVWNESVGPGGEFAQTELFQGLTLGRGHFHNGINRQRITFTDNLLDFAPSLTLAPDGGSTGEAVLAWTRSDIAQGEFEVIRFARAGFDGRWTSRSYTPSSVLSRSMDLFTYGPIIFGAYVSGQQVIQATNPPATLRSNSFTGGARPRVGSSGGKTFVAWTGAHQHVRVGEATAPGVATEADLTPTAGPQQVISVSGRAGKATVLAVSFGTRRLWARTQT
jgi:hypothetical protein